MKKSLTIVALLLAMVMLLAACGKKDEGTSSSSSASASNSIEGTWKMTDIKEIKSEYLTAEEIKQQLDEATQQLKSGQVVETMTFKDGKMTMTLKVDATVTGGQPIEQTESGTYTIDGNKIIVTEDGKTEPSGDPVEFKLNGNTLELYTPEMTAVFTRQ